MNNLIFSIIFLSFLFRHPESHARIPEGTVMSQQDSLIQRFGSPGHLIIKGKVLNFNTDFFEFGITSYLDNERKAVPVKADGSFEHGFEICNTQDMYLYLPGSSTITFTVKENDTLTLTWDSKDLAETFRIQSNNPTRNEQLQVQWMVYLKDRQSLISLRRDLQSKNDVYPPEKKYELINRAYNNVLHTMLSAGGGPKVLDNLLIDQYYDYTNLLLAHNLYPAFRLKAHTDSLPPIKVDTLTASDGRTFFLPEYAILRFNTNFPWLEEAYFVHSNNYRQFISDFFRQANPYLGTRTLDSQPNQANFILSQYYRNKGSQGSALIQDWLNANILRNSFRNSDLNYSTEAYQLFLQDCKTPFFERAVTKTYESAHLLQPGKTAPPFTLKDENGKNVSLADFKGKVVYIDFWGVYCGPCIYDIENILPKIHDYYRDKEVVFVNICVDVDEKKWKEGLKKYAVHGVNLIAEGWSRHPVCQAYNVHGIPKYVLIHKDGTIASTTLRPSQLGRSLGNNELDKALLK